MTEKHNNLGYFIMTIGGKRGSGSHLADVELTSLDPELFPVPDCLSSLNSLPSTIQGHSGALDYDRKSVFNIKTD